MKVGATGENQAEFERTFQFVLLFIGKVLDEFGFFKTRRAWATMRSPASVCDDVVAATVEQGYRDSSPPALRRWRGVGWLTKAASCGTSEVTFLCDGYGCNAIRSRSCKLAFFCSGRVMFSSRTSKPSCFSWEMRMSSNDPLTYLDRTSNNSLRRVGR